MTARADRIARGALFIVLGELCFTLMGVGIRMVADELSNSMVVFARNLVALALFAPLLLRDGFAPMRTAVPWLHLLRAAAGVGAMYCFFLVLAKLPLAEAMLFKLTTPIFIPLIALAWLREPVSGLLWLALAVGFGGVLFILNPQPVTGPDGLSPLSEAGRALVSPFALIGLLGGALAALALVTVRRLSRTEPAARIVFHFALIAALISALPLVWTWQTPSLAATGWLCWIGVAATLGQLALTRGLALAPAARMGAFAYAGVVFGAALGWLLWGEPITAGILLGSGMVALAAVLASRASKRAQQPVADATAVGVGAGGPVLVAAAGPGGAVSAAGPPGAIAAAPPAGAAVAPDPAIADPALPALPGPDQPAVAPGVAAAGGDR